MIWWVATKTAAAGLVLLLVFEVFQLVGLVIGGQAGWSTDILSWYRHYTSIGGQVFIDSLVILALLMSKLGMSPSKEDIMFPEITQIGIIFLFVLISISLTPLLFLGLQRIQ